MLEAVDGPLLSPADEARWRRLVRKQDRDDFTAARMAALLLMGFLHDAPATAYTIHQFCDVCGGRHGRPTIPNPSSYDVSWSHDQGVVAVAVGPGRIGIDVLVSTHRMREQDPNLNRLSNLSVEAITRAEALAKVGAGSLGDLLSEAENHATQETASGAYLSDNNQRLRMQCLDVDGAVVSVASTCDIRSVVLEEAIP